MNKSFQRFWSIFGKLIPRHVGVGENYVKRSHLYFSLMILSAKLFGGARQVYVGDSNSEVFRNRALLSELDELTLCLGQGGSRPSDWVAYFSTWYGRWTLAQIRNSRIVWSIGGNAVLFDNVAEEEPFLGQLHSVTVGSWNIMVPPVHAELIAQAKRWTLEDAHWKILSVNRDVKRAWSDRAIDPGIWMRSPQGTYWPGLTSDGIHYSPAACRMIQNGLKAAKILK